MPPSRCPPSYDLDCRREAGRLVSKHLGRAGRHPTRMAARGTPARATSFHTHSRLTSHCPLQVETCATASIGRDLALEIDNPRETGGPREQQLNIVQVLSGYSGAGKSPVRYNRLHESEVL